MYLRSAKNPTLNSYNTVQITILKKIEPTVYRKLVTCHILTYH